VTARAVVEVAYGTDLAFARRTVAGVADDYLGDEMEANMERCRRSLVETPVDLEVQSRPSVNIVQEGSWVKLECNTSRTRNGAGGCATNSTTAYSPHSTTNPSAWSSRSAGTGEQRGPPLSDCYCRPAHIE